MIYTAVKITGCGNGSFVGEERRKDYNNNLNAAFLEAQSCNTGLREFHTKAYGVKNCNCEWVVKTG